MKELTIKRVQEVIALAETAAREASSAEADLTQSASDRADIGDPFPEGWDRVPRGERRRLVDYLEHMTGNERAELVALMWLGSASDATAAHFSAFAEKARREAHPPEYLTSKPLPQYLRNGLKKLGQLVV